MTKEVQLCEILFRLFLLLKMLLFIQFIISSDESFAIKNAIKGVLKMTRGENIHS